MNRSKANPPFSLVDSLTDSLPMLNVGPAPVHAGAGFSCATNGLRGSTPRRGNPTRTSGAASQKDLCNHRLTFLSGSPTETDNGLADSRFQAKAKKQGLRQLDLTRRLGL